MKTTNFFTANKTLNDLYKLSECIDALKYEETFRSLSNEISYKNICFQTHLCGEPKITANLNLPVVVSQTSPVKGGKSCNFVVQCRQLPGVTDLDGRVIYEGSNGILFVYHYKPVNQSLFMVLEDEAMFLPPRIEFEESQGFHQSFQKAAENLVETLAEKADIKDELFVLSLSNRLTELQISAFLQGKGKELPPKKDS